MPAPKGIRPAVKEVNPVPPLLTTKVPATVTAPVVAVAGVNPVVPKVMLVTAVDDNDVQVGAAALPPEVNT